MRESIQVQDNQMSFCKTFTTVEEIVSVLEEIEATDETDEANDESPTDVVVLPPEADPLSDEEDINDDVMLLNDTDQTTPRDIVGYNTRPNMRSYWMKRPDYECPLVRNVMSRNRFEEIKRWLHLADNSHLGVNDKFAKLRPFFDKLNERFAKFGIFSHELSIDEQMVPYFGRHSSKMYVKGKPVRFGFKVWCLASAQGYVFHFKPYAGSGDKYKTNINNGENLGLGEKVVLDLLSVVQFPGEHKLFFDNFFTSHSLLCILGERGYFGTGTVRESRIAKCPLPASKEISKIRKKGYYFSAFDRKNQIFVVRWFDNAVVTIASNCGFLIPLNQAKRWDRTARKAVFIPQPNLIREYNQGMGGVDLHDNGVANYRIRTRGKKWWWPLFINSLDMAAVNAWKFFQLATGDRASQLDFKSCIVLSLLQSGVMEETIPNQVGNRNQEEVQDPDVTNNQGLGRPPKGGLPDCVRKDKVGHLIKRLEKKSRRRYPSPCCSYIGIGSHDLVEVLLNSNEKGDFVTSTVYLSQNDRFRLSSQPMRSLR
ncbi:piggyBac transposable element-derived protein 3-like [Ischnura elegans]|uniref:piggyBac transposable element-derived protein 3-like n=1 Tax=Ischnura elegans TaxID=197161 RepID=UPI001ED88FDD|nr:piggyBac transposable element-derived protein 3-like [Ischnura elegans]